MADFGGDVEAFRAEARAWLDENFPKALAKDPMAQLAKLQARPESPEATAWRKALGAKGWGAPTWPKEVGGGGLNRAEAKVLAEEMAAIGARNPIGGMGIAFFGPTLMEYGSEALKKQHFPGIVNGDVWWCQGYSEPGAGSDLAGLQTRAEDKGDHFLVNGSKIWTSGAQHADRCYCLVRTDTAKKHEGISFLLIDMKAPGVEVRPILLINGASPFCETFFTDVKVPKDQLFGPLNGGWTVGKRLLQHERSGQGGGRMMAGQDVVSLAKKYVGVDDKGRIADSDLRTRIAKHQIDAKAHGLTLARAAAEAKGNVNPSATTSVMKNSGTWIGQEKAELTLEIMGSQGLGWSGEEFSKDERDAVRTWLSGKATTIFGGSQEIQSNIVSKRILGLPDTTQNG